MKYSEQEMHGNLNKYYRLHVQSTTPVHKKQCAAIVPSLHSPNVIRPGEAADVRKPNDSTAQTGEKVCRRMAWSPSSQCRLGQSIKTNEISFCGTQGLLRADHVHTSLSSRLLVELRSSANISVCDVMWTTGDASVQFEIVPPA